MDFDFELDLLVFCTTNFRVIMISDQGSFESINTDFAEAIIQVIKIDRIFNVVYFGTDDG